MDNNKPNLNVPAIFQKVKAFEINDTRFISVKIWLMHLGENLNGSYFEKDVVQAALPSLSNTPILAYIEDNSSGEDDFSDHRQVLIKEDGQYKIKYIGQAIGVIPESNNAQFEYRLCDDGVEREFLTVEGLVWQNKWDDAPDILNRDKIKSQSMELHDDYTGQFEDDNLFHFKSFKFYGACGLGKSVLPAMHNATIEVQFSFDGFKKEIQEKMEQFKQFSLQNHSSTSEVDNIKIQQEGGINIVNEKLEILKKFNLTVEQLNFNLDDISLEELESKIQEQFSLSNNQLMSEINKILDTMTEVRENYWGELKEKRMFYLLDLKDGNAIVVNYNWDTYYGIPYTLNGDIVTLNVDAKVEYVPDWRPKQAGDASLFTSVKDIIDTEVTSVKENYEVKVSEVTEKFTALEIEKSNFENQLNDITEKYSAVEPELNRLKGFEATKLAEERKSAEDAIFTEFEDLNGIKEFEEIKEKSSEYELDVLTEKCFAIRGKKNSNFSLNNKQNSTIKIKVEHKQEDELPYGGLIEKYKNK